MSTKTNEDRRTKHTVTDSYDSSDALGAFLTGAGTGLGPYS